MSSVMKDSGIINTSRRVRAWALYQVLHDVLAFIAMVTSVKQFRFEIFHCVFAHSFIYAALLLTRSFLKSLSVEMLKVTELPLLKLAGAS